MHALQLTETLVQDSAAKTGKRINRFGIKEMLKKMLSLRNALPERVNWPVMFLMQLEVQNNSPQWSPMLSQKPQKLSVTHKLENI